MPDYYPEDTTEKPVAEGEDTERHEGETALLPKSLFAGKSMEPGAEVTLKIVHVYDDEVEVECVKEEASEPSELDMADERLGDMAAPPAPE